MQSNEARGREECKVLDRLWCGVGRGGREVNEMLIFAGGGEVVEIVPHRHGLRRPRSPTLAVRRSQDVPGSPGAVALPNQQSPSVASIRAYLLLRSTATATCPTIRSATSVSVPVQCAGNTKCHWAPSRTAPTRCLYLSSWLGDHFRNQEMLFVRILLLSLY